MTLATKHHSLTGKLAEHLVNLDFQSLSTATIQETKLCILDTLGCILAGAKDSLVGSMVEEFATNSEDPAEQITVLGFNRKASLSTAIMLNGTMAHAVEMDDVYKLGKVHSGAVVVPAVLGFGELNNSSGKDVILAAVVGYEVMNRIGTAINATAHRFQGWHATSTCGTFGAAAALAKLAKFNKEEFVSALGLAGTQSSGLWAFTSDGATNKMFHTGHAASCGVTAVRLVKAGMRGPAYILEAEDGGLFKATSSDYDYGLLTKDLGEPYTINHMSRKPYACCRSMHPSIESVLKIKRRYNFTLNEIKSIKVKTYEVAKIQCGFTNEPQNVADARFSIPYGVAVALHDGNALLAQFTEERIKDQQVIALAKKVEIIVSEPFNSAYPARWGCAVEIELESGEILTEVVEDAKGDATNPLSREEFEQKFIYLTSGVLAEAQAKEVIDMIMHLEDIQDIGQLIACCYQN